MLNNINTFINDESGAVTVDWVVLTAALVGLGLAVMSVVSGGIEDLSNDIGQSLTDQNPNSDPFGSNYSFTEGGTGGTAPVAPTGG